MELDRRAFRQLVELYLCSAALSWAGMAYETLDPTWASFSTSFDELAMKHFGAMSDEWLIVAGVLCAVSLAWGLASTLGLL